MEKNRELFSEESRLEELHSLGVLDTPYSQSIDDITEIASHVCDVPISLVSFVDNQRQWFKSNRGINIRETSREHSFCAHAIYHSEDLLVVEDAREDERFRDNPFVKGLPHIIFYAGKPIISENGYPLGTLCVIDHKPRILTDTQKSVLSSLADQTSRLIYANRDREVIQRLKKENESIVKEIHHRVKNNFQVVIGLLKLQSTFVKEERVKSMFRYIEYRIKSQVMIHELLYQSEELSQINLKRYIEKLVTSLVYSMKGTSHEIEVQMNLDEVFINIDTSIPLGLVINELITNALKYGTNGDSGLLSISLRKQKDPKFLLTIADNGPGFDNELEFRNQNSLGLELVHGLLTRIKGNIEKDNSVNGTRYLISFEEIY